MTCALMAVSCGRKSSSGKLPPMDVTIAHTGTSAPAAVYVAHKNKYFAKHGLRVTLLKCQSGEAALRVLAERKAAFATIDDIPFVLATMHGREINMVATIHHAEHSMAVVARRGRQIESEADLAGKRIGVTVGSEGHYFLDRLLAANSIEKNEVELINVRPTLIVPAILQGDVDAIATWQPHVMDAARKLDRNRKVFAGQAWLSDRVSHHLVGDQHIVRGNPELARRALLALMEAEEYILAHRDKSLLITAEQMNTPVENIKSAWNTSTYEVSLRQSLIMTLENKARWAARNDLTESRQVPNFLHFMYYDALAALKPQAVTVIR